VNPLSAFPDPTQSKIHAPAVRVDMLVWMVLALVLRPVLAVASGACCIAPVTETAPTVMSVEAVEVTDTAYVPAGGSCAPSMYHISVFTRLDVPTIWSSALVSATPL
jgi:hypothetical protein